jgi:allantoin racemase
VKIRVITPITSKGFCHPEAFLPIARADTELSHVELDRGPASIESAFDEMLAVPETVSRAIEAEREGIDAVMINCMGDPGLHAAREAVSIPVIGPCEASMHAAAMMGHTFSVITIARHLKGLFENQAKVYGVREKLASVRSVEIPVLDLEIDRGRTVQALIEQAVVAVEQDEADVIIFGCTGMTGTAAAVEEGLRARGIDGVPVIDPPVWAIKLAEAMADMGLRHSKRAWPAPPEKRIDGFEFVPRLGTFAAR